MSVIDLGGALLRRMDPEQAHRLAIKGPVSYTHLDVYKRQLSLW